jgi:hypothetical protein
MPVPPTRIVSANADAAIVVLNNIATARDCDILRIGRFSVSGD